MSTPAVMPMSSNMTTPSPAPAPAVPSAAGLLSMLSEPEAALRKAALTRLSQIVDKQWHEVAQALPDLEALAEDSTESVEVRQLAASVSSRVFFYLEEPRQALRLALESGEGVFDIIEEANSSQKAYVECLVGAAVDAYIAKKRSDMDGDDGTTTGTTTSSTDDDAAAIPIEKLSRVVNAMFERCYGEGNFEHALGLALEAREIEKVSDAFDHCSKTNNQMKLLQVLEFAFDSATALVSSKAFRFQIMQVIAIHLEKLYNDASASASASGSSMPAIQKACAFKLAHAHQILMNAEPVAQILSKLLQGTGGATGNEDNALLGLQLCFDLVESGDQSFVNSVADFLSSGSTSTSTSAASADSDQTQTREKEENIQKALRVLTGGFTSELAISFLHKHSNSDLLIMENLKLALEQRGAGRNSILHNCAVMTHSYLNAGTTNDSFLRDNLEWMRKASNWAKFSATASLGVVHAGHITEAMTLLEPYLPATPDAENPSPVSTTGGYSEGGSLYALGLIHGSHVGSSTTKRKEANDFILNHLRASLTNEPIGHGAALGAGLTALGTNNLEVINELKELLYTDSAVGGEAAGIAIGLVLVGSGAGNVTNNLDSQVAEEINEVVSELKNYAHETHHEKIIRGIVMGIALMNFGQEENADVIIDELRADRDPLLRYGAQYTLALAYCGTGSNKAIRLLLHTAVSDVSDDVRMAAVIGLAFVLYKTPRRIPELVKLLLESFNPHVRYASCMAVGIAMAGSGDAESITLLEPMLNDMSDFVRQGALLGTSLIYMQQGDSCNGKKIKVFREKLAKLSSDKHQTTMTKMGAILSLGVIDAAGGNVAFDLGSKNGFTKMTSAVGAALWLQHWYWFPMMHMFSLAVTPTFTIGLKKNFKYPKGFEIQCNSKPSQFAYPKHLEEKKEEKKKRVETVALSTTAKNNARLARKKAKEETEEEDVNIVMEGSKDGEDSKIKEETNEEKMDIDGEDIVEEKKIRKKREPEPSSYRLSNPCRITKTQAECCTYDLDQRYRPIRTQEKPYGVIILTDLTPGEDEDLGTVKAPSIESEDESDPPEPFEWAPAGHSDDTGMKNTVVKE